MGHSSLAMGRAMLAGCAWLMLGSFAAAQPAAADRSQIRWTRTPKQVLAFYYGWYGNPDISNRWVHWKNVDVAKRHIDESTHFPELGAYDSHDPKIVEAHCREAKEAGITGFIVSWWRQGDFHDQGMPLMLDTANRFGLKITIYYETVPRSEPAGAVDDLVYLMQKYAGHPAWLKVGGKPVVFVYGRAVGQIKLDGWEKAMNDFTAKYPGGAVFIGDQISPQAAHIFDGIHTYNPTGQTQGKTPEQIREWAKTTFPQWVKTAGPDRISCITIIPGYDDSVQPSRKPPRPITERAKGETYRAMWEEALAANPDWVLLCSWNEWHEGSEIEPSVELGKTALETTRQFARKFTARKAGRS